MTRWPLRTRPQRVDELLDRGILEHVGTFDATDDESGIRHPRWRRTDASGDRLCSNQGSVFSRQGHKAAAVLQRTTASARVDTRTAAGSLLPPDAYGEP